MKKLLQLLVCASFAALLLLPLGGTAKAATPVATGLSVSPAEVTLYLNRNNPQSAAATITATAEPADYSGYIKWTVGNAAGVLDEIPAGYASVQPYTPQYKTLTVKASGYTPENTPRTGTIFGTVELLPAPNSVYGVDDVRRQNFTIKVVEDVVSGMTLALPKATVSTGESIQSTATATYISGLTVSAAQLGAIEYISSNPGVVRVDDKGVVTGIAAGSTVITARCGSSISATVPITVVSTDVSDTAEVGVDLSLRKVAETIRDRFIATYSANGIVVAPAVFNVSITEGAGLGVLYDSGARPVVERVNYSFSELEGMYLRPSSEGVFAFTCTVMNGVNTSTGSVRIQITRPTKYVRLSVGSGAGYAFTAADNSGKTGVQLLGEALGTYSSIRFGEIERTGAATGTLYTDLTLLGMSSSNHVGAGTLVEAADVGKLYFSPSRAGVWRIGYDAYSGPKGTGAKVCAGELLIAVDAASLDVTVNLESTDPYLFSASPRNGAASAASALITAVNDAIGVNAWSYLKFDVSTIGANPIGTLHETRTTVREIASTDFIHYLNISDLFFSPARVGTFEIGYGAYEKNTPGTSPIVSGKLRIVVSNVPTGTADVFYTTACGGKITLRDEDFLSYFRSKRGNTYYLSYVNFNEHSGDGSFVYNGELFEPYNSADYYTRTYSGRTGANPRYLDGVTFTAPNASGFTAVKFTCYGGVSADSNAAQQSGVLYIFYTAADVPVITYNAYGAASVALRESNFADAYRTATKTNVSSPQFTIRLLNTPNYGILNQSYPNSSYSTRLTDGNVGNFGFTVGAGNNRTSVETLSYVPLNSAAGSDELMYIAYDANGVQLYTGKVAFKLAADRTVSAPSEGYSFPITDFLNINDSDPVVSVAFHAPSAGKFYVAQDGRLVAVPAETRFNTTGSAADGAFSVTQLRYVPKAGLTEAVPLNYTSYRRSGASYENTLNVAAAPKTASARFADVGTVYSWAAPSVDFASGFGLVNGTGNDKSGRPQFSPADKMKRRDLVLILYRLAGSPALTVVPPYADVPSNAYYYKSAQWAYQNNIMTGVVTGAQYGSESDLTRQDFATILYNFTNASGVSTQTNASINAYSDQAQVSPYARNAMTWAVGKGYITSTSSGLTLEPVRTATRAEIVTLLHRYMTY